MAPEAVQQSSHMGKAMDIWSVGCVVIEMATGKVSFVIISDVHEFLDHAACPYV